MCVVRAGLVLYADLSVGGYMDIEQCDHNVIAAGSISALFAAGVSVK